MLLIYGGRATNVPARMVYSRIIGEGITRIAD